LSFEVRSSDVDETPLPGEEGLAMVLRLAQAKASSIDPGPATHVLAADTVVVLDGALLGKPKDDAEARRMLGALQGREHLVFTGVAVRVVASGQLHTASALTRVRMASLSAETIGWYVATGEPMDKAGAYGIQGIGAALVESVSGNYTNVVGLPIPTVVELLAQSGVDWRVFRSAGSGRSVRSGRSV
jgi:septum formation protein